MPPRCAVRDFEHTFAALDVGRAMLRVVAKRHGYIDCFGAWRPLLALGGRHENSRWSAGCSVVARGRCARFGAIPGTGLDTLRVFLLPRRRRVRVSPVPLSSR